MILYIPNIDDYLKIFNGNEVTDFVLTILSEYFKSPREKLCSSLNEKQNFGKVESRKICKGDETKFFWELYISL